MVHQEITPPEAAKEGGSMLPSLGGLLGWGAAKEEAKPASEVDFVSAGYSTRASSVTSSLKRSTSRRAVQAMPRKSSVRNIGSSKVQL